MKKGHEKKGRMKRKRKVIQVEITFSEGRQVNNMLFPIKGLQRPFVQLPEAQSKLY